MNDLLWNDGLEIIKKVMSFILFGMERPVAKRARNFQSVRGPSIFIRVLQKIRNFPSNWKIRFLWSIA